MKEDLIGIWSADHIYGPGAQADEILVFKEDGTGRLDIINFTLCSAQEFRWEIPSANHLNIIGVKNHQNNFNGNIVVEANNLLNLKNIPFTIAIEQTPSGQSMRVIRIKLMDYISDHFGFVRKDIKGLEEQMYDEI